MPHPLIVGNWKMNGMVATMGEIWAVASADLPAPVWIAPPFTLIAGAVALAEGRVVIGGQDCHAANAGAHTGDVSAAMLADCGARFVITGHSERRADHAETDAMVRAKAAAARAAGLSVIVCVGETEPQRDAGDAEAVVAAQLAGSLPDGPEGLLIAYEPIWAIGTGRTPTPAEIAAMHNHIGGQLTLRFGSAARGARILYGGSVNPANAPAILALPEVAGALVGGASLTAASLLAIASALN